MLNILFHELQAFPATPVGDFILFIFLFRCKYIKNVKDKVRIQGIFCEKIYANDYTGRNNFGEVKASRPEPTVTGA